MPRHVFDSYVNILTV